MAEDFKSMRKTKLIRGVELGEKFSTALYERDIERSAKKLFREVKSDGEVDIGSVQASLMIDRVAKDLVGSSDMKTALAILSEGMKARGFAGESDLVRAVVAQARAIVAADVAEAVENLADESGVDFYD